MLSNLSSLRKSLLAIALCCGFFSTAQVSDNFTDGDFTNAPAWTGDNGQYLVNGAFQLQLNGTAADTSYLSTPGTSVANAEWNFWVRENFAPSDNNNVRFYVVSDIAILTGAVNGYYIRLGENGSFDSVDLWKQTGSTHVKIIDGINAHCAASNNILRVRLTRDATGNWNLYSDITGGYNYLPEGNVFDNTYTTSNYIGIFSKYTVSNITAFYYDDIYAGPVIVDVTAPTIVSAVSTSATTVDVTFNENVELTTSQTASNYAVDNSIGNPLTAIRDAADFAIVHLTFSNNFISSTNYILTVSNVQDLNSNAITTATANFLYFPLGTPAFHDVIINEIFADPSPVIGLPNAEFAELFNRSSTNFDLSGWKFTDGSSTGTLGAHILPAGGYVILCANADTASFSPFGPTLGLSSWPSLNNAGDNLKLFDAASNVLDSVNYTLAWYRDGVKDDGGWTLELINPDAGVGCSPSGNWIASVNSSGGTPGIQNSVFNNSPDITGPVLQSVSATDNLHVILCFNEGIDPAQLATLSNYDITPSIGSPVSIVYDTATLQCVTLTLAVPLTNNSTYTITFNGLTDCAGNAANPNSGNFAFHLLEEFDIVINEIMADPNPTVQLPDAEYLELYNTTPYPVSIGNWTIAVGTTVRALPAVIIPADSFLVLTSTTAATLFTGINVAGVTSFPTLTNSGGTIVLRNNAGNIIHSVNYIDSWYQNSTKAAGGWSLEQIDPLNPCAGAINWRASNATSGGTPGYRNSIYAANPDAVSPALIRVSILTADSIRLWFSESLDSASMVNLTSYVVNNGIGNPISIRPIGVTFSKCDLKLASSLLAGITYTITVDFQLHDCVGNQLDAPGTAVFALPEAILPNDIVINEVLFDPNVGGVDFVEIFNRSAKVLDLKNLVLCTQDTITNTLTDFNLIAPEGYLLFPGQYLVLSESSAAVQMQYPNSTDINRCLEMDNIPSMNVDGDIVVLADTGIHIIDKLIYFSTWHFPLLQNTKGVSLERIDFDRTTQDATNWHSAAETAGSATPTQQNSEFNPSAADDGAVTITEQLFSPDGDGYNDVLNIDYHFTDPGYVAAVYIYDARGRLVRTLIRGQLIGTEQGTYSWDGTMDDRTKARVGAYIIYFEVFSPDGKTKTYKRSCVLAAKFN
ncbi:hypothetical protein BH11BAC7_BH11BAC7_06750 [soil metagenome]